LAKKDRMRKENKLVPRVIHPLFKKSKEQLREHDSNLSKEAEAQRKSGDMAGISTPAGAGGRMIVPRWS
jgi:hypothetical protein